MDFVLFVSRPSISMNLNQFGIILLKKCPVDEGISTQICHNERRNFCKQIVQKVGGEYVEW